jgi:hypothetical protein
MRALAHCLHRHYWLSALLLGCLVLRAFVPAGFMVDTDASGSLQLKLCSGYTLTTTSGGAGPGDDNSTRSDGLEHQGACPFSAPLLAFSFAFVLGAAPPTPALTADTPSVSFPRTVLVSPSRLPRGPPALTA